MNDQCTRAEGSLRERDVCEETVSEEALSAGWAERKNRMKMQSTLFKKQGKGLFKLLKWKAFSFLLLSLFSFHLSY